MTLAWAGALSHSPVLYRPKERWQSVRDVLIGSVPQPAAATEETPDRLDEFGRSLDASFRTLRESMLNARLDALVILAADRQRFFDESNCPQVHVFAGEEIWGDAALTGAGEASRVLRFNCDTATGDLLIEELFDAGFDIAESHGQFRPVGDPTRGAVASLVDPIERLQCAMPVIPIHLNCHMAPALQGARVAEFGAALGAAIQRSPKRVGLLASGGMSGDPGGYLAGWVDPMLDRWVLRQIETGRSARLAPMFDVESNALRGSSAELRLWLAVARAIESQGGAGKSISYQPMHAAAAGIGFLAWENPSCR